MKKNKIIKLLPFLMFTAIVFFSGYFIDKLVNKIKMSTKNTDSIVSRVLDMYLVPENEAPTMATVTDPEVLKDKLFFVSSQKGDKVLIFTKTGKAVLYRPDINKIIEIVSVKSEQ